MSDMENRDRIAIECVEDLERITHQRNDEHIGTPSQTRPAFRENRKASDRCANESLESCCYGGAEDPATPWAPISARSDVARRVNSTFMHREIWRTRLRSLPCWIPRPAPLVRAPHRWRRIPRALPWRLQSAAPRSRARIRQALPDLAQARIPRAQAASWWSASYGACTISSHSTIAVADPGRSLTAPSPRRPPRPAPPPTRAATSTERAPGTPRRQSRSRPAP